MFSFFRFALIASLFTAMIGFIASHAGCPDPLPTAALGSSPARIERSPLAASKRVAIASPPELPRVAFTQIDGGWPPRMAGRTNERVVPLGRDVGPRLDAEVERHTRILVERDARVRAALSESHAFLRLEIVTIEEAHALGRRAGMPAERVSAESWGSGRRPILCATIYDYLRRRTLRVLVAEAQVVAVVIDEKTQPPLSDDERLRALKLAHDDPRIALQVRSLEGGTIGVNRTGHRRGAGHRLVYVTFTDALGQQPSHFAVVDLTTNTVLEAGAFKEVSR